MDYLYKFQKLIITLLVFLHASNLGFGQDIVYPDNTNSIINPKKLAFASRTKEPPTIDGILSEDVWDIATPISDFVQDFPNNLTASTEKTEVRLLFDDYALYVGVDLFDSSPSEISERLARRDDWMAGFEGISDWFTIDFDSRYDHQTGFVFAVNASGVQMDATVFDDTDYDEEWNAVWHSEISKDMTGWHIEIEIPFSIMRYTESDSMVWGMDMARYIHRKNEHITWIPRPRGVRGIASRYGKLMGFDHVPAAKQIEILPYVLSGRNSIKGEMLSYPDSLGSEFSPLDRIDRNLDGGVDVKYGIGSNSTIDLTINPDFGWIEADPAIINLTYYETYFSEKRPFFLENSTIFDTPIEMFYSRRIGKMDSRILTAGKLSGKSQDGLSYSVLGALTSDYQSGSWASDLKNEGLSYYLASRLVQDILMGNSFVGLMFNSTGRDGHSTNDVAADQLLSIGNNRLIIDQQIALTDITGLHGLGYAGEIAYDNETFFSTYFSVDYFDDNFDNNDLGYNLRNDLTNFEVGLTFRKQEPGPICRYAFTSIDYNHQSNLDGLVIGNYVSTDFGLTFNNYWRISAEINRSFRHYDDKLTFDIETQNLGPYVKLPQTDGAYFSVQSDQTKQVQIGATIGKGKSIIGDWGKQYSIYINLRPTSAIETSMYYSRNRSFEKFHWLEITEEIINESFSDSIKLHYMFSESKNQMNILTWRVSAGLATNKSIEFYSEYFMSRNHFNDQQYLELLEAKAYPVHTEYQPYSSLPDDSSLLEPYLYNEFYAKYSSLNLNLVFRWEFSPGSTFYLIYTTMKTINGKESVTISDFWNYQGGDDWSEFSTEGSLYIKLNYRFNRR
ncbi:MAG: carbohydrate binding family 9 domain-containing protein [Candidatus Marinimicrobia bacterium]|nr:carbohydrate binding family 9 domain-containing protein [Candidatus Neomarinimicrobiota bacterium]